MITKEDLKGVNTYGYKYTIDDFGYLFIDLPHAKVMVHERPSYCDRGRFGFDVEVKREHLDKLSVDFADCFPRYFFKMQRAFDEAHDWIEFNKEKLGINQKKIYKMNIAKFNKAEVLATLYNNATVQGMGIFQADGKTMTKDEAQKLLDETHDKYFDYVKGRVMKVSLKGDELDTRLYNRDNGNDAAERVLAKLLVATIKQK